MSAARGVSAPWLFDASTKHFMQSTWPRTAATWRGESPRLSRSSVAPAANSARAHAVAPTSAQRCSGVAPSPSVALGAAPAASSMLTQVSADAAHARSSAARPRASRASTAAPWRSRSWTAWDEAAAAARWSGVWRCSLTASSVPSAARGWAMIYGSASSDP